MALTLPEHCTNTFVPTLPRGPLTLVPSNRLPNLPWEAAQTRKLRLRRCKELKNRGQCVSGLGLESRPEWSQTLSQLPPPLLRCPLLIILFSPFLFPALLSAVHPTVKPTTYFTCSLIGLSAPGGWELCPSTSDAGRHREASRHIG